MRKRKPVFTAKEKTDEELKGFSKLNMDLTKGAGVKAVEAKVRHLIPYTKKYFVQHRFKQD